MRSSKESLKILFDNACNDKEGFIPLMNESYLNVEKDLEVLEIIRTHKLLNYVVKNKKCATMYHLTNEELNTLKEWLENDK